MTRLAVAVDAYKKSIRQTFLGRQVEAVYEQEDYVRVKEGLQNSDLLINCDDESFEIEYSLPSLRNEIFASGINEILSNPERCLYVPDNFYLADIDYFYVNEASEDNVPDVVQGYLDAVRLTSGIIEISDHFVGSPNPNAIFLHGSKVQISLVYDETDLVPLPRLDSFFQDFLDSEIHKKQKGTIIKSVLFEMLSGGKISSFSFSDLIKEFDEFVDRVEANYQLYVSEFSFEKIKAQVEKEVFDFTVKINKVFSDIQNQVLAVPVAVLVVGSQMKNKSEISVNNAMILAAAMIFSLFVSFLIKNQRNSLSAIKGEVDSQWDVISNKHIGVSERLGVFYNKIDRRYKSQKRMLVYIDLIVSISVIFSGGFFVYMSGVDLVIFIKSTVSVVTFFYCIKFCICSCRVFKNKLG